MPTPSTRTPVRIARGSYSNLNGSVSDLQDGEISYAEDQDKLYIKEGGSLVALTYTPASPAFTGTITGVNLTLSGDLTVNGTTTTINTQTLDVEDKNVVIGKVSSPSDTTADGGGWTLKGASDKTFNWVNATDAWTSSEHIHVLDNKKLLVGTGSDLSIYHDGTDSIISNATNVLKTHSSHLFIRNAAGNEDIAKFVQDGAVELYHNNVKKLETTSAGVTVTGTVSDSKGDVRSIPYVAKTSSYTLVAADAGKCISSNSGGWTIPNNVMSSGDAVTLINVSGGDLTITKGSGLNMYFANDASNTDRTLATRGVCTIYFLSGGGASITGAGLS